MKWIVASILCFQFVSVFAQDRNRDNLESDEKKDLLFVVTGKGEVSYERGKKIDEEPSFKDTVKVNSEFTYTTKEVAIEPEMEVEPIKAPRIVVLEPLEKLYSGNLTLGVNDFVSAPFIDFTYDKLRSKEVTAGMYLNHFSSGLNADGLEQSRFAENEAGVHFKKIKRKFTWVVNSDYNYDLFRYYGYDQGNFEISPDSNKLFFSHWNTQAGLKSNQNKKEEWSYNAYFNYDQFFAPDQIQEHMAGVKGEAGKYFNWKLDDLEMDLSGVGNAKLNVSYLNSQDSTQEINSVFADFVPTYNLKHENLDVTVGARVNYLSAFNRTLKIYPHFDANLTLVKDIIIIYGGWDGGYQRNHYLTYYQQNPFIATQLQHTNTNKLYEVSGGIKGAISSKSSFNVGFKSSKTDDFVFFINDFNTIGNRKFNIWQDDLTHAQIYGELVYENDKIRIAALGQYNEYNAYRFEAFHLPDVYAELSFDYNLQDKIKVGTDIYYFGEQLALHAPIPSAANVEASTITLNPILDFNFRADYQYSKKLSAFVLLNNILSQNHQRWNQYPNYGINFMVGANFAF
jgi:hypothetical protein